MTKSNSVSLPIANEGHNPEAAVRERYSAAAQVMEPSLCCAVEYPREYLEVIPAEVIERDYGCGDPSAFVREGETVVDLGSGGGKICFIAAQLVGPSGRIIGVDSNAEMLELARRSAPQVAERIGYGNVEFKNGLIQDLALDLDRLAIKLTTQPVTDAASYLKMRQIEQQLRDREPMIADESVDCVLSNCVLNLVRPQDRHQLFSELYRVIKNGGRAAISDIVASADVPVALQRDATLWSGCISGAYREDRFVQAFVEAGFSSAVIVKRQSDPWQVVGGIEFRSVTVVATKGLSKMEGLPTCQPCCNC